MSPSHRTQAALDRPGAPRRAYQLPTVRELPRRWDPLADREIVVHSAGSARLRGPTTSAHTGPVV
jgi:hypothetical protein